MGGRRTRLPDVFGNLKCCICEEFKPPTSFYRSSKNTSGYKSACKSCAAAKGTKSNQANTEFLRARQAPRVALLRFMDDHPDVFAEFIHIHRSQFKTYVLEAQDSLTEEVRLLREANKKVSPRSPIARELGLRTGSKVYS